MSRSEAHRMKSADRRCRFIVFGRLPEPGHVKTRLHPAMEPEQAADLYQGFLDDAMAWATEVEDRELWVPDRPDAEARLGARYPGARIRLQPEGSLGDRLAAAFDVSFSEGVDYVVVAGSDHPTLPLDLIGRFFRALRAAHLALGPTRDGGYYAIALRRYAWPQARGLFEAAPWSTPELLAWTRERAEVLDLCHVELPAWYDVDRPEDLNAMSEDLRPESATARAWARITPKAGVRS